MEELTEWMATNKISHKVIDEEVIEIPGFGKMFFEDTGKLQSVFKKDKEGNFVFNSMEHPQVLIDEGINYSVFKFGDNFYYTDLRGEFRLNILKYTGERIPAKQKTEFVNLGVHTPYELLNGSFMPKMWIKKAKFCGHAGIGICDKNTMAGCYGLQKECEAAGIKFVFGYSLSFTDTFTETVVGAKIYVQTNEGLQNLLRIQKIIMVDSEDRTILFDDLLDRGEGNVIVLDKHSSFWIKDNPEAIADLKSCFDQVFYQVDLSEFKAEKIDIKVLQSVKHYFDEVYGKEAFGLPPVLLTDCYYLDRSDAKNKIILNKIAEGAAHEQSDDQYYKDADEHYELFEKLFDPQKRNVQSLFEECCRNSMLIIENASARFDNTRNFMPKYDLTPEEKEKYGNAHNMFNQIIEDGLKRLVPDERMEEYRKQAEYEKYIIESTNNVDYLLVQYDTCKWARENGILAGCGRGSAAGSLLLYLMGVTLIDPIKYGLIFERFLLPERAGLYPSDTTIIGEETDSCEFIEVTFESGKTVKIDKDAEFLVRRGLDEEPVALYADELEAGDCILFDNRDELFTINEL
jgi:DNA polymerase-3 subunit alpha